MERESNISSTTITDLNQNSFLCKCFFEREPECEKANESVPKNIDDIVSSAENYLKERRIPELIRFLLAKVLAEAPDKPVAFLEKLLNECMLFRAGHGMAPTLYELRHLQAVMKSFDPGQRGWLSAGQVRRLYASLGLETEQYYNIEDRFSVESILEDLQKTQKLILYQLLSAGIVKDNCN